MKIHLALKENSYDILIGNKILSRLGKVLLTLNLGQDAVIITNPVIEKLHGKNVVAGLKRSGSSVKVFTVPDGEKSKSARFAFGLLEKIAHYDVGKKIFIVALGGGVVGDLSGFVAAVYKRGTPYVQVPTTLLGQIDSAIGGKVAIDLVVGKNLVGAFYQPKLVFSDVSVLSTLSVRQIQNGLSEAVKYGVIDDERLFSYIEKNYARFLKRDPNVLAHVVEACSRIKARIVTQDEKETKGLRAILNFGHTVGHAIETAGGYNLYHHGEAVALGMRVAADISHQLGLLSARNAERLNELLSNIGLPLRIKNIKLNDILSAMRHDKKFKGTRNRLVLAKVIGKVVVREGIPLDVVRRAIAARLA